MYKCRYSELSSSCEQNQQKIWQKQRDAVEGGSGWELGQEN
jgi:hypothetical protein